ncbi:hypothetical protein QR46_3242 [Giardia duodenalis assemblage B]|uniref:Uncharacterized protein n=1 Tax=Giardia duodenalis assemblage B TaxID=1394984 RepID=A0A132NRR0_GIAIN|nr:hypothetical protein QR46_3242 [Giardia intestinalis assemblage B]
MQGLKEAYVKESRADRSNITTVVLSGGEPQYTITIDRRHVIDVPNMYKASYYSISVSPEINGIILFKTISAQGSTICKLVPCLMLSGSLDCAVPYIQKLVDFLYMYNSYMTGRSNQDILIEANRICREFNLSSLKVINTVASLAKGIRLNIRPYLALKNNTYTREEAEEASKSYLAEYRSGLDDAVKTASKTGAVFTRTFMREYVKQYTHFLTLSVSCERFLKTIPVATIQ